MFLGRVDMIWFIRRNIIISSYFMTCTYIQYLLQKELPANKGTDVRFAKKVFSLLNIVPIVKSDSRMVLMMEGESSIIADLQDLREVLYITQNFDGLPKFKIDFFNEIFLPCYAKKTKPDSSADGSKTEEIIGVTTRELCDYYKDIKKIPKTTDNLKHTYLNQLINEGIIDYTESKINTKQYLYYPLVTESLSIESIMSPIDKDTQQSSTIYEKIIKNITEGWIFHEIIGLSRYRLSEGDIETVNIIDGFDKQQLVEYIKNAEKISFLDKKSNILLENEDEEPTRRRLTTDEFIQQYCDTVNIPIDNKPSNILTSFAKRSYFLSILGKIDNEDIK